MRDLPILLVHGFASSFDMNWRRTGWADLLADAGRQVIPLDLPGHGAAPKSHDPADYDGLERHVAAVLPDTGPVDAVGFSLGAGLLLRVAAQQPERFGRLVVAGVGRHSMEASDGEAVARAIEGGLAAQADEDEEGEGGALGRAFAQFALNESNDPAALAACMRRSSDPLTPELLARVRIPVLVVLGDRDFVGPAAPLVDALPDARLVTIRGADHFGTPQRFEFIDAALEFLDAVPA